MTEKPIPLTPVMSWTFGTIPGGNVMLVMDGVPDEAAFQDGRRVQFHFGLSAKQALLLAEDATKFARLTLERERRDAGHA